MLSKCLPYRIWMGQQRHSIVYHGELSRCVLENKEEVIMPLAEDPCRKRLGP